MGFPIDDGINSKQSRINGKSVIEFEPSSINILHDFIFKNEMPN